MQTGLDTLKGIHDEFVELSVALDERRIRLWCAARARAYNRLYGRGGVSLVHHATGVSRPRIYAGIRELEQGAALATDRNRQPGGGRKKNA
jgi:hypothetical protein